MRKERYRISELIQANHQTRVFLAHDEVLDVKVVLKEISGKGIRSSGDYEVLKNLKHYGLPRVLDAFDQEGKSYLVIEHIDGPTLREAVEKKGSLDEKIALERIRDILMILDYLHKVSPEPVIHGDVRPENVILGKDRTVLIDFGSVMTEEGSNGFFAPERLLGTRKIKASDIYSTGLLLQYMLTGQTHKGHAELRDGRMLFETAEVIRKCTRRNPGERYFDAGMAVKDIHRILSRMNTENSAGHTSRIVTILGCPWVGCEMAWVAASVCKIPTLIIDLDVLNPSADLILGISQCKKALQDLSIGIPDLKYLAEIPIKVRNDLDLVPCRVDIESFENISVRLIEEAVCKWASMYRLVVVAGSDFIYDALSMSAVFLSDHVFLPVSRGLMDIRRYNALIGFLQERQSIDPSKFLFFQFESERGGMRKGLISKAVHGTWMGSIKTSRKRKSAEEVGICYARHMEKSMISCYQRILKRILTTKRGE